MALPILLKGPYMEQLPYLRLRPWPFEQEGQWLPRREGWSGWSRSLLCHHCPALQRLEEMSSCGLMRERGQMYLPLMPSVTRKSGRLMCWSNSIAWVGSLGPPFPEGGILQRQTAPCLRIGLYRQMFRRTDSTADADAECAIHGDNAEGDLSANTHIYPTAS